MNACTGVSTSITNPAMSAYPHYADREDLKFYVAGGLMIIHFVKHVL